MKKQNIIIISIVVFVLTIGGLFLFLKSKNKLPEFLSTEEKVENDIIEDDIIEDEYSVNNTVNALKAKETKTIRGGRTITTKSDKIISDVATNTAKETKKIIGGRML